MVKRHLAGIVRFFLVVVPPQCNAQGVYENNSNNKAAAFPQFVSFKTFLHLCLLACLDGASLFLNCMNF